MNINKLKENIVLKTVGEIGDSLDTQVQVTGGFVRDLFLEKESKDIDIVCENHTDTIVTRVAKILHITQIHFFKNYGTYMFKYKNYCYEFVQARKESYRYNSRNPIVTKGSLHDDKERRDFTINTISVSLNKHTLYTIIDPFNGIKDIHNKILKTPLEPIQTYSDDPLRMLRAIRFSNQLNFTIEKQSFEAITKNKHRLNIVSKERIFDETHKILQCKTPILGIKLLIESQLIDNVFSYHTISEETLKQLDIISRCTTNTDLKWASIFYTKQKPILSVLKEKFKSIGLPIHSKLKYIYKILSLTHTLSNMPNDNASILVNIRHFLFEAKQDFKQILVFSKILCSEKNYTFIKEIKKQIFLVEEKEKITILDIKINGYMIQESFGIPPCKEIGIIKEYITHKVLDKTISNTKSDIQKLLLSKGIELGLKPIL